MPRNFSRSLFYLSIFCAHNILHAQHPSQYISRVRVDSNYQFINTSGQPAIPGKYKFAHSFSEGLAFVRSDSLEGYINTKGEFVIRFGNDLLTGEDFHEGLAAVFRRAGDLQTFEVHKLTDSLSIHNSPKASDKTKINFRDSISPGKDFSYGYIDHSGKMVIPSQYDFAGDFSGRMARVNIGGKMNATTVVGGNWGYINQKGKLIISLQFEYAGDFREGLASVKKNGKYGYINMKGEVVIDFQFTSASDFVGGIAVVEKDGTYGIIKKNGKFISNKIQGASIVRKFSEGFFTAAIRDSVSDSAKITLRQVSFDENGNPKDSILKIKEWVFIDKKGNTVLKPECDYLFDFSEGLVGAGNKGGWGFIDKKGKWVIPAKFESVGNFSCGLAPAKLNGKWGFINKKGEWKISPSFDWAEEFVKKQP